MIGKVRLVTIKHGSLCSVHGCWNRKTVTVSKERRVYFCPDCAVKAVSYLKKVLTTKTTCEYCHKRAGRCRKHPLCPNSGPNLCVLCDTCFNELDSM